MPVFSCAKILVSLLFVAVKDQTLLTFKFLIILVAIAMLPKNEKAELISVHGYLHIYLVTYDGNVRSHYASLRE